MRRRDVLFLGAASAVLAPMAARAALPVPGPVVETRHGKVQGLTEDGIEVFRGLRYGAPPTGAGRFKPPAAPAPWDRIADATEFGAPAMQLADGSTLSPRSAMGRQWTTIFKTPAEVKIDNEDCLFLNVWSPKVGDGRQRPVMVWLHGGGFEYGSGAWPLTDGANLARKGDVVVVTVNHRLNLFGYLYLAELAGPDYAASGNAGMLDIVLALQWVRDHIGAFGGDPGNVTIFGESGGGVKVSTLMAMPAAKGLFHKAIVQSGPGLKGVSKAAATASAKAVLEAAGVDPKAPGALQAASADALLAAALKVPNLRLGPVVDGETLPHDPFDPAAPAISKDVPLIIGANKDEMTLFTASAPWFGTLTEAELAADAAKAGPQAQAILSAMRAGHLDYSPTYLRVAMAGLSFWRDSIVQATRKAAQGGAPVWMYELVWETPVDGGRYKTPHTLDVPLVFDNAERGAAILGSGPEPRAVAAQMSDAWLAFARTGRPDAVSIPKWPPYEPRRRAVMAFDVRSRIVDDPRSAVRAAAGA